MPIQIYVWLPDSERLGHGAMRLTNGTYISWWPEEPKNVKPVPGSRERSLPKDIRDEGSEPNYIVAIPSAVGLDESAMKNWWDTFKTTGKWNLITNCCWVVEEALINGGIKQHLNVKGLLSFSRPSQLLALMKKIEGIDILKGDNILRDAASADNPDRDDDISED